MSSDMTFNDFVILAENNLAHQDNKHYRRGQLYWNLLALTRPDLAERVKGTMYDPFYQDSLVEDMLKFLEPRWSEGK